jgi:hypothetical protein
MNHTNSKISELNENEVDKSKKLLERIKLYNKCDFQIRRERCKKVTVNYEILKKLENLLRNDPYRILSIKEIILILNISKAKYYIYLKVLQNQ